MGHFKSLELTCGLQTQNLCGYYYKVQIYTGCSIIRIAIRLIQVLYVIVAMETASLSNVWLNSRVHSLWALAASLLKQGSREKCVPQQ